MRQNPASSSAVSSTSLVQEVSGIAFSANRATSETRLLRSKVCQMIQTALQAMADASCKTLRRRVGQRLRRKLGRILMQEEFEQALTIYKHYEDEILNETEAQSEASALSVLPEVSSSPHSVTSSPHSTAATPAVCVAVPVPVIAVPVLVPVMASAHGHVAESTAPVEPAADAGDVANAEPVEPVSPVTEVSIPTIQPYLDVQKDSRYFARMCTESTSCTGSTVMDDEDFLDQHIDWARAVSDAAPVERTFIQFNTNLKVTRRSRSR